MGFGSSGKFKLPNKGSFKAPPEGYMAWAKGKPKGAGTVTAPGTVHYTGAHVKGVGSSVGSGRVSSRKSLNTTIPKGTSTGNK